MAQGIPSLSCLIVCGLLSQPTPVGITQVVKIALAAGVVEVILRVSLGQLLLPLAFSGVV